MSTATLPRRVRVSRNANFQSKAERKRVRKGLARAAMSNWVAEKRSAAADRAEFYRNLRLMKMRRREIAKAMRGLAISVTGMQQQLRRVEDRHDFGKTVAGKAALKTLDESLDLARAAVGATEAAASEWEMFAKRKIYFTELVG